ncbi:MAG: glycoside hydrolase family 13 protein [Clostridia bacterium]|nr:glycoside hydrolase family 13 protein [Clostridia bacterium]
MRTMPYNSRDTFYKSIFGSVEAHKCFKLSVLLPRDGYVKGVVAHFNKDNEKTFYFEMTDDCNCLEGNFYTRSTEVSLEEGLYFYHFIAYTSDGEREILNIGGGFGDFEPKKGTDFQLTVYEKGFETPIHTRGGIIYQIFPDRFSKGENSLPYPDDRYIKTNWSEQPEYTQDNTFKCLGNDYYCGNLKGIEQKLDYIDSLGVTMIYLNPIFEAHSNHRYNTANYFKIDPLLGSEEDFVSLCATAKKYGIDVILDGVFSHTGDDSLYFNAKKRYGEDGAYNNKDSKYYSWYKFKEDGRDYHSWWGVKSLPETNENDPSFTEFITGENGVIRYWMRRGAAGFRLDVADELPDAFLDRVRIAVKSENRNGYLLGEVWEDATNKISYGSRRRFLRGRQLDSVMNYPFANAIIDFVCGGNGKDFAETIMTVLENYPPQTLHNLMNHIGTHDTARILTRLAGEPINGRKRDWQAKQVLTEEQYNKGKKMLKLAALLQYTLVGLPSLYYGDEAGLSGYGDPFCRATFPWDNEDVELLGFYKKLGAARKNCSAFKQGSLEFLAVGLGFVVFKRYDGKSSAIIGINRWGDTEKIPLDINLEGYKTVFGNPPERDTITINGESMIFLVSN